MLSYIILQIIKGFMYKIVPLNKEGKKLLIQFFVDIYAQIMTLISRYSNDIYFATLQF